MSEGSDNKNLVLGLISTGRDRPSVREKPMASPPPAKTDDDGGALPIAAAGRTQFRDLVAKGESRDPIAGRGQNKSCSKSYAKTERSGNVMQRGGFFQEVAMA